MKDKLIWPLIGLLILCLGILVLCPDLLPGKEPEAKTSVSFQDEYGKLASHASALKRQISQAKKKYNQDIQSVGTVTLLFQDFGEQFIAELLPAMEAVNFVGTLAFTGEKHPGAEGCLTPEEWNALREKGWTCCLYWDGATPLDPWLEETSAALLNKGFPAMDTLCFGEGLYQEEHLPALQRFGIKNVIHVPESKAAFASGLAENEVWKIGAAPWCLENAKALVNELTSAGTCLVLTVQNQEFRLSSDYILIFRSMMDVLGGWHKNETLAVMNIPEARDFRLGVQQRQAALEIELTQTLEDLQTQLDDITRQMDALLNK